MKHLIRRSLSTLLLCIATSASYANAVAPEFTKELFDMCNSTDVTISEKCSGYIWGVGDTLNAEYGMNDGHISYTFNIPRYTKLNLMLVLAAMRAIIHTYPERLNQPAVTTVIESFQLLDVWKYKK